MWEDEKTKTDANKNYESIIYVECVTKDGTPYKACVAYLRGAIKANFPIIFVYDGGDEPMGIFNVEKLETKFGESKENADRFIQKYGDIWFFCKCKEKEMKECMNMIKGINNFCKTQQ